MTRRLLLQVSVACGLLAACAVCLWAMAEQSVPTMIASTATLVKTFSKAPIEAVAVTSSTTTTTTLVSADWSNVIMTSQTMATLQVVSNPLLNRQTTPVVDTIVHGLQDLQADLVRYVPWFPYPRVGVAELEPPNYETNTSYWDFANIQPQLYDVVNAVTATVQRRTNNKKNNRVVINFSTQPAWQFNTSDWSYPPADKLNQPDWSYPKGLPQANTTRLVAEYYGRLASWLLHGHFVDEFGTVISGGPAFGFDKLSHWEVFNEPEGEHQLNPTMYLELFDAVVQEIRRVADPDHRLKFVGLALSGHFEYDRWQSFLNQSNHAPGARDALDMASFHWYGSISSRTNVSAFVEPFVQMTRFLEEVDHIVALRDQLSPTTQLNVDEAGVIPPNDNGNTAEPSPPIYYNMVAALYTVLFCELTVRRVEVVGSSQLCGCPVVPEYEILEPQFPGVSMTNWTTGNGNPRYWGLKLLLEYTGVGDQVISVNTTTTNDQVEQGNVEHTTKSLYIQARITPSKHHLWIVVNQTPKPQYLAVPKDSTIKGTVHVVDETTHDGPWKSLPLGTGDKAFRFKAFAVAIIEFHGGTGSDDDNNNKSFSSRVA